MREILIEQTNQATLKVLEKDGRYYVQRIAARGKIRNLIDKYEYIDKDNNSTLISLDLDHAKEIVGRIKSGAAYSGSFLFYEDETIRGVEAEKYSARDKSIMEHQYTSTGIKFWRHQEQMMSYVNHGGKTVVSTHISPEGACNLACAYCSVTYRDTHSRIELDTIKDYIIKLKSRGLKACVLSGGGESTLYHSFNELVQWLHRDQELKVALITNGTTANRVKPETWKCFSWVRVSINLFDGWEEKIYIPRDQLDESCVVGASMVFTVEHEASKDLTTDRMALLERVGKVATKIGAKYIRLLPNCLLEQSHLIRQHGALDKILQSVGDARFFHQYKLHQAPNVKICHQAYFRPYLSEEPFAEDGISGSVYPCDSVVLNEGSQFFAQEYQICRPADILDFLDGKIQMKFDPRKICHGCVFTDNVNMLDKWKNEGIHRFDEFKHPIQHENFI